MSGGCQARPVTTWAHWPRHRRPPDWVEPTVTAVEQALRTAGIDTTRGAGPTSNEVLAAIRPALEERGFEVERRRSSLRRPVLWGDDGQATTTYEVDAVHDRDRVVVEVEAGRSLSGGNAVYRDLLRSALIETADHLLLVVPVLYHSGSTPEQVFEGARSLVDAIYASGRLELPFESVVVLGY